MHAQPSVFHSRKVQVRSFPPNHSSHHFNDSSNISVTPLHLNEYIHGKIDPGTVGALVALMGIFPWAQDLTGSGQE
jgi:hypothetical protein